MYAAISITKLQTVPMKKQNEKKFFIDETYVKTYDIYKENNL